MKLSIAIVSLAAYRKIVSIAKKILPAVLLLFFDAAHAEPAMSRSNVGGKHASIVAEDAAITARSYVQNGLIVHLDGIENAGYRTHVDGLQRWQDLKSDNIFQISTSYQDCVSLHSGENRMSSPSGQQTTYSIGDELSLHVVLTAPNSLSWTVRSLPALGRDIFGINGFVVGAIAGKATMQAYWCSAYSGGTRYSIDTGKKASETFAVDIVFNRSSLQFDVYVDAAYVGSQTISQSVWNLDGKDVYLFFGSNSAAAADSTGCRIFNTMVYNRCLDVEEIEHNYSIDKVRFGL